MTLFRRQKGIALIAALLAVALATTAAVYLMNKNELYKRRTANMLNSNDAHEYIIGAEAFAIKILFEDAKDTTVDTLDEPWNTEIQLPIPGGLVHGRILDLQGRFNINNLTPSAPPTPGAPTPNNAAQAQFQRLVQHFNPAVDLASPLLDWIDADFEAKGVNGAEDQYYLGLEKPYRTANRAITDISELRLLKDMNDELFTALEPFITVLPVATAINVNTAPAEVLMSLNIDITIAESLVTSRSNNSFETVSEFTSDPILASLSVSTAGLSVTSNFFLLQATVTIDRGSASINSIIYRDAEGKGRVIARSLKTS